MVRCVVAPPAGAWIETGKVNNSILHSMSIVSDKEPIRYELLDIINSGDVGSLEPVIKLKPAANV